jgi:hypothetical protein
MTHVCRGTAATPTRRHWLVSSCNYVSKWLPTNGSSRPAPVHGSLACRLQYLCFRPGRGQGVKNKTAPIIPLDTYRELRLERQTQTRVRTARGPSRRAHVIRRSEHRDLFASRPEAPTVPRDPPYATPLTDAIHSAARNENTTFFRLPQLARQTLQGTGQVQPVTPEQASDEVDLDRFAPPLPPTPLLVPRVGTKKG